MNVLAIGVDEPHFILSTRPMRDRRTHERRSRVGREVEDDPAAVAGGLVQLQQLRVGVRDRQVGREDS